MSFTLPEPSQLNRRSFLNWGVHGLGATALASMLGADEGGGQLAHFAPKAKRAINICLVGGLSQVDSFDYKPALERFHGKVPPGKRPDVFFGQVGRVRKNDWNFQRRGRSGLWISDLFPHLAGVADELTVIRSMHSETGNHTPALFLSNSGFQVNGFPALGSWLSYGLGNLSNSLPAFVVMPDARGAPSGGASSWSNGFLPGEHQGVPFSSGKQPVRDLFAPKEVSSDGLAAERELLAYIQNRQLERLGGRDSILEARVKSYELAARMQVSIPGVSDISGESKRLTDEYGLEGKETRDFARNCILARRLLERGVRFVQLFAGGPLGGKPRTSWDGHEDMVGNHTREAKRIDQPVAALLKDLRRRGMLEDTLVTFTSEFGRTPFTQSAADKLGKGRDHNNAGFTVWMAGAGLKPGVAYGESDEIGYSAAVDPVSWHDFHATVLHLLGLDHERLTFYHNGIQRRLTNVHGRVIREILS
jgi:hypothetical protein